MGIPIARVLGIEIRVSLAWVVVLAIVTVIAFSQLTEIDPELSGPKGWLLGGIVAFGFFMSSLSHDLAHAIVARRRGVTVDAIAVSFFGGSTPLDPASPDPRHDVVIAASGPAISLGIAFTLLGLTTGTSALGEGFEPATGVLAVLVFLNLVLGVVNLVPAYPLDGGRIVRDLAWRRTGSEEAGWRVASRTGRLSGIVAILAGIAILLLQGGATGAMLALTGWFLILSANALRQRARLETLVRGRTVGEAMEPDPITVSPGLTVDTFAAQLLDRGTPLTAVPVVRGNEIVGLLGARQVQALRRSAWTTKRVEEVMVRPPALQLLSPSGSLKEALERLYRLGLDGLPVVADGELVGVLTRSSVGGFLRRLQGKPDPEGTLDRPSSPPSASGQDE
ncbi:MAG TPA: site-2 protease family protein [Candidatus Binatia bacterium]|nr:site-2 protease family protein [Candidatus Binatia bacterium]